jgi:hypothetical protein
MLTLHELQNKFVEGLNAENNSIFSYINSNPKISAIAHLNIYQSSIFGALQKTLNEIFPVCKKLVGNEFFIAMINEYIEKNVSYSPDLANYGSHFSDFISEFKPVKSLPYLPDIARLEWAWHAIYSARQTKKLDMEGLASCYATSGEKIIFHLPPNSFLLSSPYPVHRIWELNQDSCNLNQTIILENNVQYYFLVWRKELEMRIDLLDAIEWQILEYVKAKFNLGELYEKINEMFPKINFETLLPSLFAKGWLTEFEIEW